MKQEKFHIKINSSKENMDRGFSLLMTSGASIFCLPNEEYIVPGFAVEKLNGVVSYELVITKEGEKSGKAVSPYGPKA